MRPLLNDMQKAYNAWHDMQNVPKITCYSYSIAWDKKLFTRLKFIYLKSRLHVSFYTYKPLLLYLRTNLTEHNFPPHNHPADLSFYESEAAWRRQTSYLSSLQKEAHSAWVLVNLGQIYASPWGESNLTAFQNLGYLAKLQCTVCKGVLLRLILM